MQLCRVAQPATGFGRGDAQHVGDDSIQDRAEISVVVAVERAGDIERAGGLEAPRGLEPVEGVEAFRCGDAVPIQGAEGLHRGVEYGEGLSYRIRKHVRMISGVTDRIRSHVGPG